MEWTTNQLNVNGTVSLGGNLIVTLGFTPPLGSRFTIINNDGTDPVQNTFSGLTEGNTLVAAGRFFRITYQGGSGNDVVLIATNSTAQAAHFTSVTTLTNRQIQLQGSGGANLTYFIEANTNLSTSNWADIGQAHVSGGTFIFVDTNAPLFPSRFYRALSP